MASPTPNKGFTYPAHGGSVNAWDTPLNTDFDQIDAILGDRYNITCASTIAGATFNSTYATISSTVTSATITSSLSQKLYFYISGALTQNLTIQYPAVGSLYIFNNQTSGGFSCNIKTVAAGSTTVTLVSGVSAVVTDTESPYAVAQSLTINTTNITNAAVTYAKIQNVAAGSILGRSTASSSSPEELSVTAPLAFSGTSLTVNSATTSAAGAAELATAAEMVTGTDTGRVPSVSVVKNHEGVCKAWGLISAGGTLLDSYGITSSSHPATGVYVQVFSANMSSTLYAVVATCGQNEKRYAALTSRASNTFTITTTDEGGTVTSAEVSFSVFGTLA